MEYYPCKTTSSGACSLFLFSVYLSTPLHVILPLSLLPLSSPPTVCLSLCFSSSSPHIPLPSPHFAYSPLSYFPLFLSFVLQHHQISVWNLPPIRGLNPPVQPPVPTHDSFSAVWNVSSAVLKPTSHSMVIGHYLEQGGTNVLPPAFLNES